MNQIELIKAEIERRMKINQWDDSEGSDVAFSEDKRLLSFIESLEKEPSQGLDEAAEEYAKNRSHLAKVPSGEIVNVYDVSAEEGFKAGAKWMMEQRNILRKTPQNHDRRRNYQ